MSKKHLNPKTLPFHDPDKLHCPSKEVAALITEGRYAPSPTVFQEEDKPFPFWLFLDDDPSGTRTPIGCLIVGPVTLQVGDLLMLRDEVMRITGIVQWSGEEDITVELSNGKQTSVEIAICGQQTYDLTMNGDCQGRDSI